MSGFLTPPWARRPTVTAGAVVTVVGSRVAAGIPASADVDSSVLTLTASAVHPGTGESVVVTGSVLVLTTRSNPTDPCRLHVEVLDASGVGAVSGDSYRAFGTFNVQPREPIRNATASATNEFKLAIPEPPPIKPGAAPNPVAPLPVRVTMTFDGAGNITAGAVTSPVA